MQINGRLSLAFPNKTIDNLRTKCPEKQISALENQGCFILKPWDAYFSTRIPLLLLE